MPPWMALLLITAVSLLTGWIIIRPFLTQTKLESDWLALLMASITLGTIAIGLLALILAELGLYSLTMLGAAWLILIISFTLIAWQKKVPRLPQLSNNQPTNEPLLLNQKWEKFFLILWVLVALWLFFRPHQFIHGGADAGVYINLSANINHTGSIVFQDETFAQLEPSIQTILSRPVTNPVAPAYLLPAFFFTDLSKGEIQPQFYPFHPVWQAIAFGLGGLNAALLMSGFWALLGCLAIYLFVRQLCGWETAVLAITALSLSAMQVWFARYPTTELQTQYFLWMGFWATAVWLNNRQTTSLWPFLAGSSFGVVFLVRIDIIFMLPILLLFITWFWATKQKETTWFAIPLLLLVTHSLIHALTQTRPYFFDLYNFGINSLVKNQSVLIVLLLLGFIGLAIIIKFHELIQNSMARFRRPLLSFAILILIIFALYNWFLRPYSAEILSWNDQFSGSAIGIYNHENLLRLGWYLSPLGILLGLAGICWMVWRVNLETAVMLAATLFFTLFYLWNIRNNPHQIYAMRRYVPAVLPLFIVATVYLINTLWQQRHKWIKGAAFFLTIGWILGIIWSARGFITRVDYATIPEQITQLNTQLSPNSIIIFQENAPIGVGDFVGTPLRFLFEHDVYKLHLTDASIPPVLVDTIKSWQNNGRTIYWVGDSTWLETQNIPFAPSQTTISSDELEGSYTHKPTEIKPINWVLNINEIK